MICRIFVRIHVRYIRSKSRIFDIRRISVIVYSDPTSDQTIRIRICYPKKSKNPKILSVSVFTIFESGSGRIFSEPYYIPNKKGRRKEKKKYYKKKGGDAHVCREWDSDESSTDSSSDEDVANITVNKGLLFPNVGHKCLMARDGKKKVKSRASTKYATSSDEDNSSDDEDNLLALFANLNMQQKEN
jgi:hypothetical protein